jgi:hypothetical protein
MEYETEIEINDQPVEVVVKYEYEPPCGDGWHEPSFPEQINIYSVVDSNGAEVDYPKKIEALLEEEIAEHVHRKAAEYAADRAEYLYESHRDFLMDR